MTKEEMDTFLTSIGGLKNGYYTNRPPITDSYFFSCDIGWYPLIKELIEKLILIGWNKETCQVKEKFGGLRFYVNELPEGGLELISEFENKSLVTCEKCGESGKLRGDLNWWTTLCDEHYEKSKK